MTSSIRDQYLATVSINSDSIYAGTGPFACGTLDNLGSNTLHPFRPYCRCWACSTATGDTEYSSLRPIPSLCVNYSQLTFIQSQTAAAKPDINLLADCCKAFSDLTAILARPSRTLASLLWMDLLFSFPLSFT